MKVTIHLQEDPRWKHTHHAEMHELSKCNPQCASRKHGVICLSQLCLEVQAMLIFPHGPPVSQQQGQNGFAVFEKKGQGTVSSFGPYTELETVKASVNLFSLGSSCVLIWIYYSEEQIPLSGSRKVCLTRNRRNRMRIFELKFHRIRSHHLGMWIYC